MIFSCKFLIPGFQLFSGKRFPEPSDFFCIQMGIRHLNRLFFPDRSEAYRSRHNTWPEPVNLHRAFQMLQFFVNAFDLINTHGFFFCKNTVRSSLYPKDQILIFRILLQRNLRPVAASHLLLNFAVDTAAFCIASLSCTPLPLSRSPLRRINSTRLRTEMRTTFFSIIFLLPPKSPINKYKFFHF